MQNPVVGLYERGRFNVSCYQKVYLGAGARKAEVDGFDKEGALLVALRRQVIHWRGSSRKIKKVLTSTVKNM